MTVSPVGGGGQVAVIQDITEMKQLQAMQLAAEQEKTARVRGTFERYMSPALVDGGAFSAAEARAIRAEGERVIKQLELGKTPYWVGWEGWRPPPGWKNPSLPPNWDLEIQESFSLR